MGYGGHGVHEGGGGDISGQGRIDRWIRMAESGGGARVLAMHGRPSEERSPGFSSRPLSHAELVPSRTSLSNESLSYSSRMQKPATPGQQAGNTLPAWSSPPRSGHATDALSTYSNSRVISLSEHENISVEHAKRIFLQSWTSHVENIKKSVEMSERQAHLSKYDEVLADCCKRSLANINTDTAYFQQMSGKVDYRHLPSLIENAKSYTTNPKYTEWQSGILNALPYLEGALQKLKVALPPPTYLSNECPGP
eukprot:767951-Hanusia_phi.AAC.5